MSELIRNLEEATDKAIKTGEKVITMQCPCCCKIFYAVESEAAYQYDNPASQDTLNENAIALIAALKEVIGRI